MRGRAGKQPTAYLSTGDDELVADLSEDVAESSWHFASFAEPRLLTDAWADASPSCVMLDLHQPTDGAALFGLHRLHQLRPHAALVPMLLLVEQGGGVAVPDTEAISLTLPYSPHELQLLLDTVDDSLAADQPALVRRRGRHPDEAPLSEAIVITECDSAEHALPEPEPFDVLPAWDATVFVEPEVPVSEPAMAEVAPLHPPETLRPPATPTRSAEGQLLVLIADDDPHVVTLLAAHGKQAGWAVCTATDGGQAEWLLRSGTVDVAILSEGLCDGAGLDIITRLRADALCTDTRFVALSADEAPERMMAAFRAGYVEYIVKPFDPLVAAARVEQVTAAIRSTRARQLRIARAATHAPGAAFEDNRALGLKPVEWVLMVGSVLVGVGVSLGLASLTF